MQLESRYWKQEEKRFGQWLISKLVQCLFVRNLERFFFSLQGEQVAELYEHDHVNAFSLDVSELSCFFFLCVSVCDIRILFLFIFFVYFFFFRWNISFFFLNSFLAFFPLLFHYSAITSNTFLHDSGAFKRPWWCLLYELYPPRHANSESAFGQKKKCVGSSEEAFDQPSERESRGF